MHDNNWINGFVTIYIAKSIREGDYLAIIKANVKDPFLKEYPEYNVTPLSAAIMQAKNGDTVQVGDGLWGTSSLSLHDVSLTINGEGVLRTYLRITDSDSFLEISKHMHLTIKNCTILVGDGAHLLTIKENMHGKVQFINVSVVFENEFDPVSQSNPVIFCEPVDISKLKQKRAFVFQHCQLPYVLLYGSQVTASYAMIGDLFKTSSYIEMKDPCVFENCTIHHTKFVHFQSANAKEMTKFTYLKTNGEIELQANAEISGLYITKYQSGYEEKINILNQVKSVAYSSDEEDFTFRDLTELFDADFTGFVLNLSPFDQGETTLHLKGKISLANDVKVGFIQSNHCQVLLEETTVPMFSKHSMIKNSNIRLIRTIDKSFWDVNTSGIWLNDSQSNLAEIIARQKGTALNKKQVLNVSNEDEMSKSALGELNALIGLADAKNAIQRIVSVSKMNQERKRRKLSEIEGLSLHTLFMGSAGVGKTTVARLFAKALYENGVLKTDKVNEVTSKDLIAGYVGQTRPLVHEVVMNSLDGVLFIDEAYSLGGDDEFAQQAVDQLIADMENYRNRLVVILAGYTNEMKELIATANPGLKSRFTNYVYFKDYSERELVEILRLQLKKSHAVPRNKDALIFACKGLIYLKRKTTTDNFGNGRFVRNFVETLLMFRDVRLSKLDTVKLNDINLQSFVKQDVQQTVKHLQQQMM